ncbi:WbqC family protein [Winogradskyella sp.]|uniref:WbqC family protein n=1 Tax=Winogradskyella sp. TaxID=1883156 RepID=UPI002626D9A3|nr:WbqC family protein [Winogradskyella sp.]
MHSKKVAILQSNYIPWKGYFDIIASADVFVIYDEVQYTKNDWRNRNLIKTKNGLQWLTIPVRHKSLSQKINETEVINNSWRRKHYNSLQANYGKSPYFSKYKEEIKAIYDASDISLSDINRKFIELINTFLDITTDIVNSESLNLEGDRRGKLIDACKKLGATTYISGPAAKDYIDVSLFLKNDIEISWMDYANYNSYSQLYGDFEHKVSVLDLLFNEGPNSRHYLKY